MKTQHGGLLFLIHERELLKILAPKSGNKGRKLKLHYVTKFLGKERGSN